MSLKNRDIELILKVNLIALLIMFYSSSCFSQLNYAASSVIDVPKLKVRKTGPYIGIQQGKYNLIEFGGELQHKKVKLVRPDIHGFRLGFNYDFKSNVLGYEAGYWYQQSRVGLTYGALMSYYTNFDQGRIGIAPVLGFRLTQFHLQTGFHFRKNSEVFQEVNTFFIALKFVLINKRKRKIDK